MSTIGKPERVTQNRVIALFRDELDKQIERVFKDAAEGHPASVMDMSFATQALASEWAVKNRKKLTPKVYEVPKAVEDWVAKLKLSSMGIRIDTLSQEQQKYLSSWTHGT